jgi:hypothetical protein
MRQTVVGNVGDEGVDEPDVITDLPAETLHQAFRLCPSAWKLPDDDRDAFAATPRGQ